ncbi:MAG: Glucokinase [Ignavibacteriae bacterium]|nr:MAG: Glucokinase [Ignavibacteriota bacterium]
MSKRLAIGIDIGATTIKGGIVDVLDGRILFQKKVETLALQGPNSVLRQLNFLIKELMFENKYGEFSGIGVGAPGIVEIGGGVVKNPPNFSDWNEINVGEILFKEFRLPVLIENDANVAALGEAKYGAGINFKDFLFVIWGTGVGGGIILDGKIFRGPSGGAGEIGHTTIDYNGPVCNCGNRGCIESYIGQRYLSERTREKLMRLANPYKDSKILQLVNGKLELIEPAIISLAAAQGDEFAKNILLEAANLLGISLASILNILDLRVVIIGGGISESGEYVINQIQQSLRSRVLKSIKNDAIVIKAKLGNNAGILGAASLVMEL